VAQTCWWGYGVRWTENKEQTELVGKEPDILSNARQFYEPLAEAFPEVDDVLSETIIPAKLSQGGERTSLLSSSTTIRALAAAWYDLRDGHRWGMVANRVTDLGEAAKPMSVEEITKAFASLPSMNSGSHEVLDRFWLEHGVMIEPPRVAPTARAGNVRAMAMAIVEQIVGQEQGRQ
jgi:hypothetical protein